MGLFSFVKNAGAKLFGRKKDDEKKEAVAEQTPPAATQEELDLRKADELINAVKRNNIQIDSLYVAVEDDRATISGTAPSQAEMEKAVLIVGNVEGIAQVDSQIEVEKPEPQARFHEVKSGDTLSKIAKQYYGDAMKYPQIFEANKPMLKSADLIYPGQVLRIPNLDN